MFIVVVHLIVSAEFAAEIVAGFFAYRTLENRVMPVALRLLIIKRQGIIRVQHLSFDFDQLNAGYGAFGLMVVPVKNGRNIACNSITKLIVF